ncbi:hypothetical protein [Mesorhizobium sp. M0047]|uniref:hypothetical protein n=1 Tax=unclassified Mesorhizobium TaxID=325217 RepID=UPI00333B84F0
MTRFLACFAKLAAQIAEAALQRVDAAIERGDVGLVDRGAAVETGDLRSVQVELKCFPTLLTSASSGRTAIN